MKLFIIFLKAMLLPAVILAGLFLMQLCEPEDPLKEGMHMDYYIRCENGFKYKTLSGHGGTIQLFNADGTPMKCK